MARSLAVMPSQVIKICAVCSRLKAQGVLCDARDGPPCDVWRNYKAWPDQAALSPML